ncbi:MAG TPA: PP2C family protein-serine/threonine phosphatase [Magnetospirillum sp.]|jgi:sigma-B regulation protein RsbU (phosphoserine phosphatase)|nr:PP2C family protein-serine/threonine phosphatase [Magnetospirillum sp.]
MDPLSTVLALLSLVKGGRLRRPAVIDGFDFAGSSRPRYLRGGDYHDVFVPPGRGSMALAVGDVAGHDAVAARLMGIASRLLKRHPPEPGGLGRLMEGMNRGLVPHMRAGRFMTLFLAVLVAEDRSIHWVSAGHAPVLAYDPVRDSFGEVPGHDIPLGIDPDWQYHELDHTGWREGAMLVVGTDGIWEARNPSGELYGKERAMRVIRASRRRSAASIVSAVEEDVAAFRQGRPPADDATLVVVKAL